MNLGRLEKVALRDVWKSEAQDFTPWLAQEQNQALLGGTIRVDEEELHNMEHADETINEN